MLWEPWSRYYWAVVDEDIVISLTRLLIFIFPGTLVGLQSNELKKGESKKKTEKIEENELKSKENREEVEEKHTILKDRRQFCFHGKKRVGRRGVVKVKLFEVGQTDLKDHLLIDPAKSKSEKQEKVKAGFKRNNECMKNCFKTEEGSCRKKPRRELVIQLQRIDDVEAVEVHAKAEESENIPPKKRRRNRRSSTSRKTKISDKEDRKIRHEKKKENRHFDSEKKSTYEEVESVSSTGNIEIKREVVESDAEQTETVVAATPSKENLSYDRYKDYISMKQKAQDLKDAIFRCNICEMSLSCVSSIVRHVKSHGIYKCNTCKETFPDKNSMKIHEKTKLHIKLKRN